MDNGVQKHQDRLDREAGLAYVCLLALSRNTHAGSMERYEGYTPLLLVLRLQRSLDERHPDVSAVMSAP